MKVANLLKFNYYQIIDSCAFHFSCFLFARLFKPASLGRFVMQRRYKRDELRDDTGMAPQASFPIAQNAATG